MSTPPPGHPPPGPPPPTYQAGGYPTSNYPVNPYPPVPPTQPKKKRRGLVIGLGAAAFVVVIGLAATVIATTTGHSPFTPSDPTPTLKGSGDDSGWAGHLPDPCVGVPDDAIRAAGLNPASRNLGWRTAKGKDEVMISCYYRSPYPSGSEYNSTYSWSLSIDFLIDTYQEYWKNSSRVDQRRTKINGQPATFFRIENWGAREGQHECILAVGTVFGIAIYQVTDDLNLKLTQQQTCDKTVLAATHFQPYISTAPLPK